MREEVFSACRFLMWNRYRLPVPSLDYQDHLIIGFVTHFVSFELNISKVSFCKIISRIHTNVRMSFVTTRHGHLTFTNTKPGFVFVNVND